MSEQQFNWDQNMSKKKEVERLILLLQELSDEEIAALNAKRLQNSLVKAGLPLDYLPNALVDVHPSQSGEQTTESVDAIPSQEHEQKLTSKESILVSVNEIRKKFEIQINVNEESPQGYISDQENSRPTYIKDPSITNENDQTLDERDNNFGNSLTEKRSNHTPSNLLPFYSNSKEVTTTIMSPGRHNNNFLNRTENHESSEGQNDRIGLDCLSSEKNQNPLDWKDYRFISFQSSPPSHKNIFLTKPATHQILDDKDCHFGYEMSQSSQNKNFKPKTRHLIANNEYQFGFQMSTPTQNKKLWTKPKPQQPLYGKDCNLEPKTTEASHNSNLTSGAQQPLDGFQMSQFNKNKNFKPDTQQLIDNNENQFGFQMSTPSQNKKLWNKPKPQQRLHGYLEPKPIEASHNSNLTIATQYPLDGNDCHSGFQMSQYSQNNNYKPKTQQLIDNIEYQFGFQMSTPSQHKKLWTKPKPQQPHYGKDCYFEPKTTEASHKSNLIQVTQQPLDDDDGLSGLQMPKTQQQIDNKEYQFGFQMPTPTQQKMLWTKPKPQQPLDGNDCHFGIQKPQSTQNKNLWTKPEPQDPLYDKDCSLEPKTTQTIHNSNLTQETEQPHDVKDPHFRSQMSEFSHNLNLRLATQHSLHVKRFQASLPTPSRKFCNTPETQHPTHINDLVVESPNTPRTHNENSYTTTKFQQPLDGEDYNFTENQVLNIKKLKTPKTIQTKVLSVFKTKKPWSYDFFPEKINQQINLEGSGNESDEELGRFVTNIPRQRVTFADPTSTTTLFSSLKRNLTLKKTVLDEKQLMKKLANTTQELIDTERSYVETMFIDIEHFELMFLRRDCPSQMHSKKEHLFGPIKEIALFHRDKLLPILPENPYELTHFFEEFLKLISNNSMYLYVLYTINKCRSQAVIDNFFPYIEYYENLSNRKLGIQSLLLQPIQRLTRYPLMLEKILKNLYSTLPFIKSSSSQITVCVHLIQAIKNKLINVANEANQINDIFEWELLNVYSDQNKFHKVLDLYIKDLRDDHTGYPGKLFIFDKSIIYTEKMNGGLMYRDYFNTCKKIDIIATNDSFRMAQRGGNVLELRPIESNTVQLSLKYLQNIIDTCDMINSVSFERDSGLGLDC